MYNLSYYKEDDQEAVKQLMIQNPFAMLIGVDENQRPVATQVPILVEDREAKLFLLGHVMRKSDHQLAFEKNSNALVIFTGPHTYVSASWYSNQQTASTWNYIAVKEMTNVFKLSQNRDSESHENIIQQLNERGDADSVAIAMEMSKRKIKS